MFSKIYTIVSTSIWIIFNQWIPPEIPTRISSGFPPEFLQGSPSRITLDFFPVIQSGSFLGTLKRSSSIICYLVSFSWNFSKDLPGYYSRDFFRNAYRISTWNVPSGLFRNFPKNLFKNPLEILPKIPSELKGGIFWWTSKGIYWTYEGISGKIS